MHIDPFQPILQVQVSGKVQFPLRHGLVHIATSSQQHEILKQKHITDLPSEQVLPVHPSEQLHLSGEAHFPLAHGGLHTAKQIYTQSNLNYSNFNYSNTSIN